jgi:hypothetical protein
MAPVRIEATAVPRVAVGARANIPGRHKANRSRGDEEGSVDEAHGSGTIVVLLLLLAVVRRERMVRNRFTTSWRVVERVYIPDICKPAPSLSLSFSLSLCSRISLLSPEPDGHHGYCGNQPAAVKCCSRT